MAKELKKPAMIKEGDLKEYAGDIVIDVTPRKEPVRPIAPLVKKSVDISAMAERAAKPNPVVDPKLLTFNVWFQKAMLARPTLTVAYKEALEAHCKALGIATKATEEQYNGALVHFGL